MSFVIQLTLHSCRGPLISKEIFFDESFKIKIKLQNNRKLLIRHLDQTQKPAKCNHCQPSLLFVKYIKFEISIERMSLSYGASFNRSSIYYFWKSGAGRFPFLMPDSIDDFRQTSANAIDGEVRKERKDVTQSPTVDDHTLKIKLFSISLYLRQCCVVFFLH